MKCSEIKKQIYDEAGKLPVRFRANGCGLLPKIEQVSFNLLDFADDIERVKDMIRDYRALKAETREYR